MKVSLLTGAFHNAAVILLSHTHTHTHTQQNQTKEVNVTVVDYNSCVEGRTQFYMNISKTYQFEAEQIPLPHVRDLTLLVFLHAQQVYWSCMVCVCVCVCACVCACVHVCMLDVSCFSVVCF